jgi:alcohol dehydrogenase (cytochrome c)
MQPAELQGPKPRIRTEPSDLLFCGGLEGNFFALDARKGTLLWKVNLGGNVASGPITFAVDGRQYVAVSTENALYVFSSSISSSP